MFHSECRVISRNTKGLHEMLDSLNSLRHLSFRAKMARYVVAVELNLTFFLPTRLLKDD